MTEAKCVDCGTRLPQYDVVASLAPRTPFMCPKCEHDRTEELKDMVKSFKLVHVDYQSPN